MKVTDFPNLVMIADNVNVNTSHINPFSLEVDKAYASNVNLLKEGFKKLFKSVVLYDDPRQFLRQAKNHRTDIIFPYWHGESSRNKHAIVAAVCEIEKLIYIGPDTYTNIVCSDKIIAKDICRLTQIKYPKFKVISDQTSDFRWPYRFPAVVKPIYEGSSIGITQENLVNNVSEIKRIAEILFNKFGRPVLVEEFIGGIEINISLVGWKENVKVWSAAERVHQSYPNFFERNLYSFEEKNVKDDIVLRDARHLISPLLLKRLTKLFGWLDKIEYIRIDGKFVDGEFYCLELSQDPDMHPEGSFFTQLKYVGYNFVPALELLVTNCLERYNNLNATSSRME